MPAICMYPDRLFIEDVVINGKNEISGWVVNGAWAYKEVDGVAYAMQDEDDDITKAVNSWKIDPRKIVTVQEKYNYTDYNEVLYRYENFEDESENLIDALDALYVEEHNMKDRSMFDYDDIEF